MPQPSIKKNALSLAQTLLCIAIAISLATMAWINGLPTTNQNNKVQIVAHRLGPNRAYIDVRLYNNGTQTAVLRSVKVNSKPATVIYILGSSQIRSGGSAILRVAIPSVPDRTYQIAFQTDKGNKFVYTIIAK
ncbi:MAG: hypothetical protein N3E52_00660 [Candidatus Bathyarchaeota archaeon]|nr:hypothetical protein [Candidatus Bathyarchaeota archaeon]